MNRSVGTPVVYFGHGEEGRGERRGGGEDRLLKRLEILLKERGPTHTFEPVTIGIADLDGEGAGAVACANTLKRTLTDRRDTHRETGPERGRTQRPKKKEPHTKTPRQERREEVTLYI